MKLITFLVFPMLYTIALAKRGQFVAATYNLLYSQYWFVFVIMVGVKSSWLNAIIFMILYMATGTLLNFIIGTYKVMTITPEDYNRVLEKTPVFGIWGIAEISAKIVDERLRGKNEEGS